MAHLKGLWSLCSRACLLNWRNKVYFRCFSCFFSICICVYYNIPLCLRHFSESSTYIQITFSLVAAATLFAFIWSFVTVHLSHVILWRKNEINHYHLILHWKLATYFHIRSIFESRSTYAALEGTMVAVYTRMFLQMDKEHLSNSSDSWTFFYIRSK